MQRLYLVRHCQTTGPAPEAPLTELGIAQAETLVEHLAGLGINRIVSSPYRRAYQSVEPLALRLQLPIETDQRLIERELGLYSAPDWLARLEETYQDFDLRFENGETNREAQQRGIAALNDLLQDGQTTVIATHGGLLSLLLNHFDKRFGFKEWQSLSNPDVYRLEISESGISLERFWS